VQATPNGKLSKSPPPFPPTCLEIINSFISVDGHEHHHVKVIKYCTPHIWMLDFLHGAQTPCFQHMPCVEKNWDMISTPHNTTMVHPTSMCLPWIIYILWNPHANIVLKHKTMQQKITYNAQSSCGASSTMKHDGFRCGICDRNFACKALNHSTKSSHVCRLTITQITSTFVWWKSNTINVIGGTSHCWCQTWHP
jgi:hypothetical protein